MTLDDFLARLDGTYKTSNGAEARCPAHEDRRQSLSVGEGDDGRLLLQCHAGCSPEAIVKAMGITMRDLFPAKPSPPATRPHNVKKEAKPALPPLSEVDVRRMEKALRGDASAWKHVTQVLNFSEDVIEEMSLGLHVVGGRRFLAYPYRRGEAWTFANCRSLDGDKDFVRTPAGQETILFNDNAVRNPGGAVIVFEGERDLCAALTAGLDELMVAIPGVNQWEMAAGRLAKKLLIYIATDADKAGDEAAKKLAVALGPEKCRRVRFPGCKDFGDCLSAEGPERALEIAKKAIEEAEFMATTEKPVPVSGPAQVATEVAKEADPLVALKPESSLDDVQVALEDLRAKVKAGTARDRAIARERAVAVVSKVKAVSSAAKLVDTFLYEAVKPEATGISFDHVEPAAEPQETGELLGELVTLFEKHAVLPAGASAVLGAWAMHTWVLDAASFTPRIVLTSPTKRCGKTLVLDLQQAVCARSILSANLSSAVLFRAIEAMRPTLLVDEADTFLADNEELRGILNAGFRSDGTVLRCDGEDLAPRAFKCFAPVAIAGIGTLPGTILDRAFTIRMSRRGRGEKVARFDRRARVALATLPPRLARWAEDNLDGLREMQPQVPESLDDRQRDISEPLIAIADLAGGVWPIQVRGAIETLCGAAGDDAADRREKLLAAVWDLFAEDVDFLTLKVILEKLLADDESEWHEAAKGKPLNAVWLARWLKPFDIKSRQTRSADRERGYFRNDLRPAVEKYLSDAALPGKIPVTPVTPGPTATNSQGDPPRDLTRDGGEASRVRKAEKPNDLAADTGNTSKNPPFSAEKVSAPVLGVDEAGNGTPSPAELRVLAYLQRHPGALAYEVAQVVRLPVRETERYLRIVVGRWLVESFENAAHVVAWRARAVSARVQVPTSGAAP